MMHGKQHNDWTGQDRRVETKAAGNVSAVGLWGSLGESGSQGREPGGRLGHGTGLIQPVQLLSKHARRDDRGAKSQGSGAIGPLDRCPNR